MMDRRGRPRAVPQDSLRASLLDRLSRSPHEAGAGSRARGALETVGLRELFDSVTRDLDWLLNAKLWFPAAELEGFEHVQRSILSYGLPDLSSYSWRIEADARTIARLLEETITRHEPRLREGSVRVTPVPAGSDDDLLRLRFRIDAVLEVEPIRAQVSFDTEVDFDSSQIDVRGAA